eukprot:UN02230
MGCLFSSTKQLYKTNAASISLIESERCKLCKQKTQGKACITHEVIDRWSEYHRLFTNIGWKGHIPESFEDCKADEDLFGLVKQIIQTTKYTPSKIRTSNNLFHYLTKGDFQLCQQHLQYLQNNLYQQDYQSISSYSD